MLGAALLLLTVPLAALSAQTHSVALASAASPTEPVNTDSKGLPVPITTSDRIKLSATYWSPRSKGSALAPAALLLHDAGGERGSLEALAERMWKQGFAVLTLDLRGHGKSADETHDWAAADLSGQASLWAFATRDVEAASQWLTGQERVHRTNLHIVGHGAGCVLAARHALGDEKVRSMALLEPPAKAHGFDLAADLRELGGLPTLILAPKDKDSPTEKMVQEANAGLADHPYVTLMSLKRETKVLEDKLTPSKVSAWLKDQAQPDGK
ncbi:MAG: alpha/beta fold hydrolase [Planctomycetota bacterium]